MPARPVAENAPDWLAAREAAALLGVSLPTLYSYVSRRLLHPAEQAGARGKRYRRSEVERLKRRHEVARRPRGVAGTALDFGLPVLESRLCLIEQDHIYLRGQDALRLAEQATLEDVAALLWDMPPGELPGDAPPLSRRTLAALARHAVLPWPRRLLAGYHEVVADWAPALAGAAPARAGWHCVQAMGVAATARPAARGALPVHEWLQHTWALPEGAADELRRALVLCADHELNVSSFTARCAASAGAEIDAAVGAALAALSGERHGGMVLRVEALGPSIDATRGRAASLQRWLASQPSPPPGFGHRLYPQGDPRGRALLARLPADRVRERLVDAVRERHGQGPTLDFGLVALCRALGAPTGAAFALFAIARTVGWVAHVLEQQRQAALIRPRAAYVGVRPVVPAAPAGAEVLPGRIIRRR